jgi:hypothetical protein
MRAVSLTRTMSCYTTRWRQRSTPPARPTVQLDRTVHCCAQHLGDIPAQFRKRISALGSVLGLASRLLACLDSQYNQSSPLNMVVSPGQGTLSRIFCDALDALPRAPVAKPMGYWHAPSRTPPLSLCCGQCTCSGNTPTLLQALICHASVSALRRCVG